MWFWHTQTENTALQARVADYLSLHLNNATLAQAQQLLSDNANSAMQQHRIEKSKTLQTTLTHGTPDAIASLLLGDWSFDQRGEASIAQRQAAVWCAIATPLVAQREHQQSNAQASIATLREAALDWLMRGGKTKHADYCRGHSALRHLGRHPQRMYALCVDSAQQHGLDAAQLLCAVLLPVLQALHLAYEPQ